MIDNYVPKEQCQSEKKEYFNKVKKVEAVMVDYDFICR